jgi:hypothetical protein
MPITNELIDRTLENLADLGFDGGDDILLVQSVLHRAFTEARADLVAYNCAPLTLGDHPRFTCEVDGAGAIYQGELPPVGTLHSSPEGTLYIASHREG